MTNLFDFGLLVFTSLFTMINPLGIIPVFISLTRDLPEKETHKTALKAVITAFLTLVLFALAGKFIFHFFGISVNSLRVVGGIIFLMVGYDMLQARFIRTKSENETAEEYSSDVAITPLAIPIICGPGAITVSIVMFSDAPDFDQKLVLFSVMAIILAFVYFVLIGGKKVLDFIGSNGNKVLMRIMGLIVMVIAVEFLFGGLKPILRDILKIT